MSDGNFEALDSAFEGEGSPEYRSKETPGYSHAAEPKNKFLKISYGATLEFYAVMRLMGYWAEQMFSPVRRLMAGRLTRNDPQFQVLTQQSENAHAIMEGREIPHPGLAPVSAQGPAAEAIVTQRQMETRTSAAMNVANRRFGYGEAATFAAWTTVNLVRDRQRYLDSFRLVVAAEKGMDPSQVKLRNLFQSDNPILRSARQRSSFLYALRYAADALFLVGVKIGVAGLVMDIVFERLFPGDKDAFDILRHAVRKTEINNLAGKEVEQLNKGTIIESLQLALQRVRSDHGWSKVTQEQMLALYPSFERMADSVLARKMGAPEVIYLMGQAAKNPEKADSFAASLEQVLTLGLRGIARQKATGFVPPQRLPAAPEPERAATAMDKKIAAIVAKGPTQPGAETPAEGLSR